MPAKYMRLLRLREQALICTGIKIVFALLLNTKPGGTGFGLPIARQAARKNLGWLRIERVRDEGTRVIISLSLYG